MQNNVKDSKSHGHANCLRQNKTNLGDYLLKLIRF